MKINRTEIATYIFSLGIFNANRQHIIFCRVYLGRIEVYLERVQPLTRSNYTGSNGKGKDGVRHSIILICITGIISAPEGVIDLHTNG